MVGELLHNYTTYRTEARALMLACRVLLAYFYLDKALLRKMYFFHSYVKIPWIVILMNSIFTSKYIVKYIFIFSSIHIMDFLLTLNLNV